jgi:preprotein translocase subunit SecE
LGVRVPPGLPVHLDREPGYRIQEALMLQKLQDLPGKISTFVTDVRSEMRKVTWPSKKEVYGTTIVVIVTVFFFGFYLFLIDSILQVAVNRIFQAFL